MHFSPHLCWSVIWNHSDELSARCTQTPSFHLTHICEEKGEVCLYRSNGGFSCLPYTIYFIPLTSIIYLLNGHAYYGLSYADLPLTSIAYLIKVFIMDCCWILGSHLSRLSCFSEPPSSALFPTSSAPSLQISSLPVLPSLTFSCTSFTSSSPSSSSSSEPEELLSSELESSLDVVSYLWAEGEELVRTRERNSRM